MFVAHTTKEGDSCTSGKSANAVEPKNGRVFAAVAVCSGKTGNDSIGFLL